jgi:hypothetical protein
MSEKLPSKGRPSEIRRAPPNNPVYICGFVIWHG